LFYAVWRDAKWRKPLVSVVSTSRIEGSHILPRPSFLLRRELLKKDIVRQLLAYDSDAQTLIIGMYVEQLRELVDELEAPLLTGATRQSRRDELFTQFKAGSIRLLAVSKVANFAVDLPDASVAIQVSGTFGSRQEEAQRPGRILRPEPGENQAQFYTLVSQDTVEQDFALKRQLFLCEQGYRYEIHEIEQMHQKKLA
jgi:DNA excision repair protein ERCC-3